MNDVGRALLIGAVIYCIINPLEKALVHYGVGSNPRPLRHCRESDLCGCQGMPSGHVEIAVLLAVLLWDSRVVPNCVLLPIIPLTAVQRMVSYSHTLPQVLVGACTGSLHVCLVRSFGWKVVVVVVPLLLTAVLTCLVNRRVHEPLPAWVSADADLVQVTKKKRAYSYFQRFPIMFYAAVSNRSVFCSWSVMEKHARALIQKVNGQKYDLIVGVLSGGAFVAKYLSTHLKIPVAYVKVAKVCDKSLSTSLFEYVRKNTNPDFSPQKQICTPITEDIKNRKVLLVDDCVDSGETLAITRNYLEIQKGARVVTTAVISSHTTKPGIVHVLSHEYWVWPWGYDS